MNEEMIKAMEDILPNYRQQLHETVWLKSVTASLAGGISPIGAQNAADDILEGFKLRFETPVGVAH